MGKVYTIGSSTHTVEEFILLLKRYDVNAVADVRSVPYSQYTPQFDSDSIADSLKAETIRYLDFSKEFGAKRGENSAYTDNKVDFGKVIKLPTFLKGVERINTGISKGYNIALLCTEKDPLDCHRFSLVARGLNNILGVNIDHILFDGEILCHSVLEKKMLIDLKLENTLFDDDALEIAYRKVGFKVAHREDV
jgi:uncharacterized protein (DUF488 family)